MASKFRFCRRCYEYGKTYSLLQDMIRLVKKNDWHCPYMKPECGAPVEDGEG